MEYLLIQIMKQIEISLQYIYIGGLRFRQIIFEIKPEDRSEKEIL
jgi:hypothetical protein